MPGGGFSQDVFAYYISVSCNHCQQPICVECCPSQAMRQDERGIVSVDPERCLGCRYCEWSCPYSAPQYDEALGRMTKCDFCQDELEAGGTPACVAACPTRALQFGEYEELAKQHGAGFSLAPMPGPGLTEPCFILGPHIQAKPLESRSGRIANPEEVRDA